MVLNKSFLFVLLIICLVSCVGEKTNEAKVKTNVKKKTVSTKTIESESEKEVVRVTHKSNEVLAKEKMKNKEKVIEPKQVEEEPKKTVENKLIKKKDETVFKIDPTAPVALQFTSHKIADANRDKEWDHRKGKYYFSELWEFNYKNELLSKGDFGHEGKFQFYLDAKTGTILIDNSQRNMISEEMIDFVIIHSDGSFFEVYTDEHGKKKLNKKILTDVRMTLGDAKKIEATFYKNLRPIGEEKKYGKTKNLGLRGRGYEMSFLKTNDKSMVYLARLPMSALPLYLFNKNEGEAHLPILFDFSQSMPSNFWVLEDTYEVKEKKVSFKLENISAATYFININDYK